MRLDRAVAGHAEGEPRVHSKATHAPQTELDIRIANLVKLLESICSVLGQESFTGQPQALDLADDLRLKIKATENMSRVGKSLNEPMRSCVLQNASASVNDIETVIAARFGVVMV